MRADVSPADSKRAAAAGRALPVRAVIEKRAAKRITGNAILTEPHTQKAWLVLRPCPAGGLHVAKRCALTVFNQAALVQNA